jgi:hypothetical protein
LVLFSGFQDPGNGAEATFAGFVVLTNLASTIDDLSRIGYYLIVMKEAISPPPVRMPPQAFMNGEVHDWYRTVWGYSDHLVGKLLDEFASVANARARVLDPFCGSGTTLVECMKRGVDSAGIDANPVSCFAAAVKTNWSLNSDRLLTLLQCLGEIYQGRLLDEAYASDPTYRYLDSTGMLARGWISPEPLKKAISLKHSIRTLKTSAAYRRIFTLALLDTVLRTAANIKFGPELYCSKQKTDADVFGEFCKKIRTIASDLDLATQVKPGKSVVVEGDSRGFVGLRNELGSPKFSLVICSPPYPAEHDYTRNSRLELAFLEEVKDRESLRVIKKRMVRSHTKGIYREDDDSDLVAGHEELAGIVRRIDRAAASKTYGFARLYSKVTMEYFGGMKRHLTSLRPFLRDGAILAYVVGDQSSYLQVPINTASILSALAVEVGYEPVEIRHWRDRTSRSASKVIVENILILRKGA